MARILIVGATSAIAEHVARIYAQRGDSLHLVGRRREMLEAIAADHRVRGAAAASVDVMDADDLAQHAPMLQRAQSLLGGLDVVLIGYGTLPDQRACERSAEGTTRALHTNAVSVIALLTLVAAHMGEQGSGRIACISSVAGDRGRASNYVYGAAKAALTAFLSGLRQRLAPRGVSVLTIKPGFVDTPMTQGFAKGPLWTTPDRIAPRIVAAIDRGKPVLYVPAFWWLIMLLIRGLPEALFMRLRKL
jgi:decaprenylphospho-beta-D-erythro-pentofuranosid-2-ulose 2-reductase